MEKTPSPAYAILTTKVLRLNQIVSAELHNNRTIPVVGSNPAVQDGVRVLRLEGANLWNAVGTRIEHAGAKWRNDGRVYAFEAIATFSPDADPKPSCEVLEKRGGDFFDKTYGRENVVAIWSHGDEKTDHLHAVIVPICEGLMPGRPRTGDPRTPGPVVSWNIFSGSYLREFSDPKKAKGKIPKRKAQNQQKSKANPVMAGWQTAWANVWQDYGLRRGIPSGRSQLPMKWIQQQLSVVVSMAQQAREELAVMASQFTLSQVDFLRFRQAPSPETLASLVGKYLPGAVEKCLAPMKELAARGIQLDDERKERERLSEECNGLLIERDRSCHEVELMTQENKLLREQRNQLLLATEHPTVAQLQRQISRLSGQERELIRAALFPEDSALAAISTVAAPRPALPQPKLSPEPKYGPQF